LSQDLADLPNGNYSLSVWARSSGAGAELYAASSGGPDKTVSIPPGTTWTEVTLGDIAVSDGQAEVGVTSSGQTVYVDDFMLVIQ
jgi:hypothetical protein